MLSAMAGALSGMLRNEGGDRSGRLDASLIHRHPSPFFPKGGDGAREAEREKDQGFAIC
jgi:hypothetical protein